MQQKFWNMEKSKFKFEKEKSFTIIELIVVIAIIAVLSAVVLTNVNGYMAKARDARRIADMRNIHQALLLYQAQYGCVPYTGNVGTHCGVAEGTYTKRDAGGWDFSSQGTISDFMGFLKTAGIMTKVPVDPINTGTGESGNYTYQYYCYPGLGPTLAYYTESGGWSQKYELNQDSSFTCK